ncbi:LacI family transcriptional regulator, partial [Clavibacter michiganensis]|uniref:LacI family DNA-binding transcriptional regulator n=1 Tax=Clavibacter michiganensis TaxID=28447 RepID=UPI000CE8FB08
MAGLPTVSDVAERAGVSRQTVSNVINSPDIVRPATRERVTAAIRELGYRPDASARRLRTRKSATIGVRLEPVLDGISGTLLDRFLHAVTELAATRGLRVLLYTASGPEEEIAELARLRDGADVDAIVLTATFAGDTRSRWLTENGLPFVAFGRPWGVDDVNSPEHLWVDVDGAAGVRQAADHLLDQGLTRIAFLGWPSDAGTGDDRRTGWWDAMTARSGLSADELDLLDVETPDDVHLARAAARDLLLAQPGLQAVVCVSDSAALGASMAATALDRSDVAVIGFDNTPVAAALGISSVEQDMAAVAAGALDLLLGSTGSDVVPRGGLAAGEAHRLITPRLVVRSPRRSGRARPRAPPRAAAPRRSRPPCSP